MSDQSSFSKLLLKYFLNWQAEQEKRASLDDFASLLGYSRPTISMWLNGTRTPGLDAIDHLASIIGVEVYDSLGMARPDPRLQTINKIWERIPPDKQQKLAEDAERYQGEALKNGSENASKHRKTAPR